MDFTNKEKESFVKFRYNFFKYIMLSTYPEMKDRVFEITWDISKRCGELFLYQTDRFAEKRLVINSHIFNLVQTIQIQDLIVFGYYGRDEAAKIEVQYHREFTSEILQDIRSECVKYALEFMKPDYEPSNEKGGIICSILEYCGYNTLFRSLRFALIDKNNKWKNFI